MTSFNKQPRTGLIVWLYTLKHQRDLRKYGYIHYMSQPLKYAVLYVNTEEAEQAIQRLNKLFYVRQVEYSHRDDIDVTFKDTIPNRIDPDLAKETDDEEEVSVFEDIAASISEKLQQPGECSTTREKD